MMRNSLSVALARLLGGALRYTARGGWGHELPRRQIDSNGIPNRDTTGGGLERNRHGSCVGLDGEITKFDDGGDLQRVIVHGDWRSGELLRGCGRESAAARDKVWSLLAARGGASESLVQVSVSGEDEVRP